MVIEMETVLDRLHPGLIDFRQIPNYLVRHLPNHKILELASKVALEIPWSRHSRRVRLAVSAWLEDWCLYCWMRNCHLNCWISNRGAAATLEMAMGEMMGRCSARGYCLSAQVSK